MRSSANLNIIVKSIEKATFKTGRDFSELEILQTNPVSASKFAGACIKRIKEVIAEDLLKMRPNYNIYFTDGDEIISNPNCEYSFLINAVDGQENLIRSIPDFTIAISLRHHENSLLNPVALAINKIIGSDLYYCEKGFGAFCRNRRIRVSKRSSRDSLILAADNSLSQKMIVDLKLEKYSLRNYSCPTLDIAYLASSKIDGIIFSKDNKSFNNFLLIALEAGGIIKDCGDSILISNGSF